MLERLARVTALPATTASNAPDFLGSTVVKTGRRLAGLDATGFTTIRPSARSYKLPETVGGRAARHSPRRQLGR